MLSGDVLSQWLQRRHGTVVQGPLVSLSRGGLLRVLETGSRPVQVVLPVVHGGQAAVVRAVDHTGAHLALRVQAVSSAEEKSRQMERLVNMTTVAVAARERPERFPAVLPVVESFVLVVPGHEIAVTGGEPEYELWCDLMPWCPGDLNGWAKATPLATRHPGAVLAAFVPLLATVRAVHEDLGIVHRDITPNNVLVDAQGRLLLADWGIAHAIAAHQTSTYTQLVGNRGFSLPPEMLAGDPSVGRYTDAWYLGSLLSWMLTDQPPGPQHGPTWLPPGLPGGPVGQQVQAVVRGLCWPDARARMDLAQAQTLLVEAAAGRASVTGPVSPAPGVVGPGASGTAVMPRPGAPAAAMRHPGTNPTAPYAHTTAQPANRGHGPLVVTSVADAPTKRRGVRGLVVAGLVVTLVLLGGLGWGIFALLGPEAPADARPGSTAPDTHTPGTQPGTGSGNDDPSRVDPGGSDAGRGLFYSATTLQQIADDFVAAAGGPQ
ncbi:MAG: protein kinase, partial [Micrococcales bacterium]|nr:protein kinase [Micrococcales bacterium]